jgi:hypothetical protein
VKRRHPQRWTWTMWHTRHSARRAATGAPPGGRRRDCSHDARGQQGQANLRPKLESLTCVIPVKEAGWTLPLPPPSTGKAGTALAGCRRRSGTESREGWPGTSPFPGTVERGPSRRFG